MTGLLIPPGHDRARVTAALIATEEISSRDRSNLYLTSQFFEDRNRYDAFIAMYAVMRVIDDLVDDVPDKAALEDDEAGKLLASLDTWESRITAAYAGSPAREDLDIALAAAVLTFPVPIDFWLRFVDAMRFDVRNPRFADFAEFLHYGEGATVAPTAMYVYLLTSMRQPEGCYLVEDFDYVGCGRDLGLFAYVAHVLRDVRADLQVGKTGLVYLSLEDLANHALTEKDLIALTSGSPPPHLLPRWRALVAEVCARARLMRDHGAGMASSTWESLPRDCEFIFRLIVGMYAELLDRIEADPEKVLGSEPILTPDEKAALVDATAAEIGFDLDRLTGPAALLRAG